MMQRAARWALAVLLAATLALAAETASVHGDEAGHTPADDHAGGEAEHAGPHPGNAVLFLFTAMAYGIVFRRGMAGFIIPYTGLLTIWGLGIGLIDQRLQDSHKGWVFMNEGIALWESIPPSLFLLTFLPILLYGSGATLDWHVFFRNSTQVVTLAFLGVGIHMCAVAVIYKFASAAFEGAEHWTWPESFLFGAIISATDPVAVVAIMKEVGASKRLGHLIEGESLLNDGSAYVFFLIFFEMVKSPDSKSAASNVGYFFELLFVAIAVGILFGILLSCFLIIVFRDTVVEVTATVTAAFLCFWLAEDVFHVSGVLAVVTLSIFMAAIGKFAISPDVSHAMHIFWEVIEFMANTVVFFYFGILIALRIWDGHSAGDQGQLLYASDWGWAVATWVILNATRFCTISLLKPFMNQFSDGFSMKDVILATWAGLRGAVGLSLALIVDLEAQQGSKMQPRFATLVVFFAGTMSVLTILVQGSTMPWLLNFLGLTKKTPVQLEHMLMAAKEVEEYADKNLTHLRRDYSLGEPDWSEVLGATALDVSQLLPAGKELRRQIHMETSETWHDLIKSVQPPAGPSQNGGLGKTDRLSLNMDMNDIAEEPEHPGTEAKPGGARRVAGEMLVQEMDAVVDEPRTVTRASAASKAGHIRRGSILDVVGKASANANELLQLFRERRSAEITDEMVLADRRSRYLHALMAVFYDGFDKGYINGEQHATMLSIVAHCLDNCTVAINDYEAVERLVKMPVYIRVIVNVLTALGRYLPLVGEWGNKVLFLNMESDIAVMAASLYAHDQAVKGMEEWLGLIEDGGGECEQLNTATEAELTRQVVEEGKHSRERIWKQLEKFKRDYPTVVRAVKTKETAHTVLRHKSRFVKSLVESGQLEEKEANILENLIQQRMKRMYFRSPTVDLPSAWEVVHTHYLFSHLSTSDVRKVLSHGFVQTFAPGSVVYESGDTAAKLYIIVRGTISRRAKNDQLVHINGLGACVGMTEVLLDQNRYSTVTADSVVETFCLSSAVVKAIVDDDELFRLRAYQIAGASLSMHLQWPFARGMPFAELLDAFKETFLLDPVPAGTSFNLPEPAILVSGSAGAFISREQLHKLEIHGGAKLLRKSSVLPPATERASTDKGEVRTLSAPQLLEAGVYPIEEDALLLTIPTVSDHLHKDTHTLTRDVIKRLSIFRASAAVVGGINAGRDSLDASRSAIPYPTRFGSDQQSSGPLNSGRSSHERHRSTGQILSRTSMPVIRPFTSLRPGDLHRASPSVAAASPIREGDEKED